MPRSLTRKLLASAAASLCLAAGATSPVAASDQTTVAASDQTTEVVIRLDDAPDGRPVFLSATLSDEAVAAIEAHPVVRAVEEVTGGSIVGDPEFSRQGEHTSSGIAPVWERTEGSSDLVIAVLDTGVAPVADLDDRLLPGASFVAGDPHVDVNGHGTAVALVAAAGRDNGVGGVGACPACTVLPVQVATPDGAVRWDHASQGILWAVDQGADVINLSFGGAVGAEILRDSIRYATDAGVTVIAAAGNAGATARFYPAAYDGAISVGAHDGSAARYGFSNHGSWVDVAAPGCVWVTTDTSLTRCGTSYASPYAAGAAALLRSGGVDASSVESIVASNTRPVDWTTGGLLDGAHLRAELDRLVPVAPVEPADGPTDEPSSTPATAFVDVDPGSYYADAVAWMSSTGISTGTTATTFSPDLPLTRAQAATLLWRAAGQP